LLFPVPLGLPSCPPEILIAQGPLLIDPYSLFNASEMISMHSSTLRPKRENSERRITSPAVIDARSGPILRCFQGTFPETFSSMNFPYPNLFHWPGAQCQLYFPSLDPARTLSGKQSFGTFREIRRKPS